MRAILNLSEATRREVGLEALRAASNAAQIQNCLTLKGLGLRDRTLRRSLEPAGLAARHGSSRLGDVRVEPQSRLIRVFQQPVKPQPLTNRPQRIGNPAAITAVAEKSRSIYRV